MKEPSAAVPLLSFSNSDASVPCPPGFTILEAARLAGVPPLSASCGGRGWCGRCRIQVDPAPEPDSEEKELFSPAQLSRGWRLACRTRPTCSATVTVPVAETGDIRVLVASSGLDGLLPPPKRGAPSSKPAYGAAVDVGTTTLAAQLWELDSRRIVATGSAVNPQREDGADIITRISAASSDAGRNRLRDALRTGVEKLVHSLCREAGLSPSLVQDIALAGNTTMQHFLAGEDPAPLARAPFRPAFLSRPPTRGGELGIGRFSDTLLHFIPGASSFVGGDAVAGLLPLLRGKVAYPSLFIDMGTNAEVVLIRKDSLTGTSAAAGPALEGGGISCGIAAVPGAIEEVYFDGDLHLRTIGASSPKGFCGSGLVDAVALLVEYGLLGNDGRLRGPDELIHHPWPRLASRVRVLPGGPAFEVVPSVEKEGTIHVTQDDIRQIQLAKAAIASAHRLLLGNVHLGDEKIQRVFLAGGFGYSLRPKSLVTVGLVPGEWENRISFAGNTSLAGAAWYLLNNPSRKKALHLADTMEVLHLAESPEFRKTFIANLDFPGF